MVLCWEFWMLSAVSGLPCFCWWVSYSYCCVLFVSAESFFQVFSASSPCWFPEFSPWCVSVDLCFHCTVLVVHWASQICRLLFLTCGKFSRLFFEGFFDSFPSSPSFIPFMPCWCTWRCPMFVQGPVHVLSFSFHCSLALLISTAPSSSLLVVSSAC